jgi:predicted amidohydrolase YtcJ
VLFLNPEIPDLWLHVARRETGSLSEVEAVEAELSAACESAGLHVAFHATDGDRAADKRHTKAFHLYADAIGKARLEEIVNHLEHGV